VTSWHATRRIRRVQWNRSCVVGPEPSARGRCRAHAPDGYRPGSLGRDSNACTRGITAAQDRLQGSMTLLEHELSIDPVFTGAAGRLGIVLPYLGGPARGMRYLERADPALLVAMTRAAGRVLRLGRQTWRLPAGKQRRRRSDGRSWRIHIEPTR
jgi:hypothetical protein